jgi:hypothetical protein
MWQVAPATLADVAAFDGFRCCDPDEADPWALEAENYVRAAVLKQAGNRTLAFREGDDLVAISSFYKSSIELPLLSPSLHEAWHLDVVALHLHHQGSHRSGEVFERTVDAMRAADPAPVFIKALSHKDNAAALAAAKCIGLVPLIPMDADYLWLVAELLPRAD